MLRVRLSYSPFGHTKQVKNPGTTAVHAPKGFLIFPLFHI